MRKRLRVTLPALLGAALAAMPVLAAPPEPVVVTLWDGFTIRGRHLREKETVQEGNVSIEVQKLNGFDIVEDGPKFVIVSASGKRAASIEAAVLPARTAYKTRLATRRNNPLPPLSRIDFAAEFDKDWKRRLVGISAPTDQDPGGQRFPITEQITSIDPYTFATNSPSDQFSTAFHTSERSPAEIRKLLHLHPDLRDSPASPDVMRRLAVAEFLGEVAAGERSRRAFDFAAEARKELGELAAKVPPAGWPAPEGARHGRLLAALDRAVADAALDELEAMVRTGRYDAARDFVRAFPAEQLDAGQVARLGAARAASEAVRPPYEETAARLREVVERESGMRQYQAIGSVSGPGPALFSPRPKLNADQQILVDAGDEILAELSFDTANRLELFKESAAAASLARSKGQQPRDSSWNLLAYAVSGWLKGRAGADADVPAAVRVWRLRELALKCQREPLGNNRQMLLAAFAQQYGAPAPDELAQVITLLPPPEPFDPASPQVTPLTPAECEGVPGVVRVTTGPLADYPAGATYLLRLPPEYQPGRSYPVLIALGDRELGPEGLIARLAEQCERGGYILAAPVWTGIVGPAFYDYSDKFHPLVKGTLRDVLRRLQADSDRVVLFGANAGANFALDYGLTRPDLFAAVAGFNANPPPSISEAAWPNAQRLPVYLVGGENNGGSFGALRKLYEKWMPRGFPALLTVYRGRGAEWFHAELPRLFDWMGRKARVRGAAAVRVGAPQAEPWAVLHGADARFDFVRVPAGSFRFTPPLDKPFTGRLSGNVPRFAADLVRGGAVAITQPVGVKQFTVMLERDLTDWARPVSVTVNGSPPPGFKAKKLEPDLGVLFEELYYGGDRKRLYLGRLTVNSTN